ncbi:hypothetical protein Pelo_5339 [Pelomyxa schiedti]|nr:hypothetical protein Pelo_5339 [Pelomyxa schiedti]
MQHGGCSGGPNSGHMTLSVEYARELLEQNKLLILAVYENQNLGKYDQCAKYMQKVQQNLLLLTSAVDCGLISVNTSQS